MRTEDFAYELPPELIAQSPAEPRDSCRLMVLDRQTGAVAHEAFTEIIDHLQPGDLLVANETRVMPARLLGRKAETGGAVEMLLLHEKDASHWECLVKPGRRLKPDACVEFVRGGLRAERGNKGDNSAVPLSPLSHGISEVVLRARVCEITGTAGERLVEFEPLGCSLDEAFHACGAVPLPPYITQYSGDPELYQTVYSKAERSAAAPTAGLHFTPELLARIREKGVGWATVELEVGVDTFRIVTEDDPALHAMHTERYHVSQAVIDRINATHEAGHRVIAVGTTSVRSLESAWDGELGALRARKGDSTSLFILPGYDYHVVDALITNFHVPRSTLMMLVSAFAGHAHTMAAYECAVREQYRMLSFGDAMFIE